MAKTKSKSKVKKPVVSDVVKAYVKKAIAVEVENKQARFLVTNPIGIANAVNTTTWALNNVRQLTPNTGELSIVQGTSQGTRIGNRIKIKSATLDFNLFPNADTAGSGTNVIPEPQLVDFFIFSLKTQSDSQAAASTVTLASFFQNGASASGFTGASADWLQKPNKDQVIVYYHKKYKLGASIYESNTAKQAELYWFANNDFKILINESIDLMKHGYPKTLVFEDNNVIPQTRQLYYVISPADVDGFQNGSTTTALPINMNYAINVEYEDA